MTAEDAEPLSAAEIAAATAQAARHLGAVPDWIARLLARKPVQINREQLAFYAAFKARFGLTEAEDPSGPKTDDKTPNAAIPQPRHATTIPLNIPSIEGNPGPAARRTAQGSGKNSPIPTKESDFPSSRVDGFGAVLDALDRPAAPEPEAPADEGPPW